jgi:DNA repair protein RadC
VSATEDPSSPRARKKATADAHQKGHRDRLRKRFADGGDAGMPDYEILEMLLFRSIPQGDLKPLAKDLIKQFGSLAGVLGATPERLMNVTGIGPVSAIDLKIIEAAGKRMALQAIKDKPVLGSWKDVIDYCHAAMAHSERELFRILFLDKRNCLITDEVQGVGTVDHAPVYPREVIRRALEVGATAIILVHNHPSGDPSPSTADIRMTKEIMAVSEPMGISVHDHIIIGRHGHVSMRGQKLI